MFLETRDVPVDRELIYDMGNADTFNPILNKVISEIEDFLKPHLK